MVPLPEIGWPTMLSAVLHVGVFLVAILGLPQMASRNNPYLHPDEIIMDVELLNQSDAINSENKTEEDVPPPPKKPVYNNSDRTPVLAPSKKPDVKDKTPDIAKEEKLAVPDPTSIKVPPKPRNKPKPEKPKKKPLPEKPAEPERNITNLLKDLTPEDLENSEEKINPDDNADSSGKISQHGNASRQMTTSDLIALNQGVQPCWNVNAGGHYAENLVVKLRVMVNQNRTVREVIVLDKMRYATDSHFKSAADAARWALLNPKCSTLNLPPEKYETWKSFIYVFDPSQML